MASERTLHRRAQREWAGREEDCGAYGGTGVFGNWVVPPASACDGCHAERYLVIRLMCGSAAGRRLCPSCAPPPALVARTQ